MGSNLKTDTVLNDEIMVETLTGSQANYEIKLKSTKLNKNTHVYKIGITAGLTSIREVAALFNREDSLVTLPAFEY